MPTAGLHGNESSAGLQRLEYISNDVAFVFRVMEGVIDDSSVEHTKLERLFVIANLEREATVA